MKAVCALVYECPRTIVFLYTKLVRGPNRPVCCHVMGNCRKCVKPVGVFLGPPIFDRADTAVMGHGGFGTARQFVIKVGGFRSFLTARALTLLKRIVCYKVPLAGCMKNIRKRLAGVGVRGERGYIGFRVRCCGALCEGCGMGGEYVPRVGGCVGCGVQRAFGRGVLRGSLSIVALCGRGLLPRMSRFFFR